MEVSCQKGPETCGQVPKILASKYRGRDKSLCMARETGATELDQGLLIMIQHQAVLSSVDPQLMKRRPHLRREREISRDALLVANDYPQFVNDFALAQLPQERTYKS